MKKILLLIIMLFLITGCSVVRIDTKSLDTIVSVVLSKDNTLFNRVGKGYKYYIPRSVTYIDTNELNDKLYSNGNYYYLYIDAIRYYYQTEIKYTESSEVYYSRKIDINGKHGYVEIKKNGDKYLIEFVYNYAKMISLVNKSDINDVILDATYILSTIKFNNDVIRLMLDDDYFRYKEEKYDIFGSKQEANNFLRYPDEINENNENNESE